MAALMMMVSATACIMDNEEPGANNGDDGLMMVSFRVVTPNQSAASRSDNPTSWEDAYESANGSDFDNLLLRDRFKVIITDTDCKEVANVVNLYCATSTTDAGATTYDFVGIIADADFDAVKTLKAGKLHIIANTAADLVDDATFTLSGQPGDSFNAIPMWGVHTVNFSGMTKGQRFDAGEVWLLRAIAKVEILLSTDDDNIITALTDATLPGINTSGYLLPTTWDSTNETKKLTYEQSFRPIESAVTGQLTAAVSQDNKIVFYLPERLNTADDNELAISVTYTTKDGKNTGELRFRDYTDGVATGAPYDIVRNHLYRYTVKATENSKPGSLILNLGVCPWGNYNIDLDDTGIFE
ncbi:MAG: hypothetical protein K2O27_02280 [Candidatus Amulumruptor sp.]|nr:hypothetical protein [Candidatus Amulumruptor sp.]